MIAFDGKITLVHHVAGATGDTYTCTVLSPASWLAKRGISSGADGAKPANQYIARAWGDANITPATGDYIVRGEISTVANPAALKSLEHFRVISFSDNRRGGLPHWRFDGQ